MAFAHVDLSLDKVEPKVTVNEFVVHMMFFALTQIEVESIVVHTEVELSGPRLVLILADVVGLEIVDAEEVPVAVNRVSLIQLILQIVLLKILFFALPEYLLVDVVGFDYLVQMHLDILRNVRILRVEFQIWHDPLKIFLSLNGDDVLTLHDVVEAALAHFLVLYHDIYRNENVDQQGHDAAEARSLLAAVSVPDC